MRSRLTFRRLSHHRKRRLLAKLDAFSSFDEAPGRYSPEFCWVLAERRILTQVNSIPEAGRIAALDAARYCEKERLRPLGTRQRAFSCLASTFTSLLATAERMLGNANGARDLMQKAALISADCLACKAEYERRLGVHFQTIGDLASSRTRIESASRLYQELGNEGHNLSWNGIAACLFASAHLHYLEGDYRTAIMEQRRTIQMLDPVESCGLYSYSLHNLSMYLFKLGDDSCLAEAEACLDEAARLFYNRPVSVEVANTNWLRGMIKARLGNGRARSLLEKALSQLIELRQWQDATLVATDLVHYYLLMRSPWEICHMLGSFRSDGGRGSWLDGIPGLYLQVLARFSNLTGSEDINLLWEAVRERRFSKCSSPGIPSLLPPIKVIG